MFHYIYRDIDKEDKDKEFSNRSGRIKFNSKFPDDRDYTEVHNDFKKEVYYE